MATTERPDNQCPGCGATASAMVHGGPPTYIDYVCDECGSQWPMNEEVYLVVE